MGGNKYMPIYSYKCSNCGKIFDKLQKVGSTDKVYCKDCMVEAFRVFSPVGIIFKGSGFYTTDYNKLGTNKINTHSAKNSKPREDSKKVESKPSDTKKSSSSASKEKIKS